MTLAELEQSLPNGLHDAELAGIQVNYAAKRAVLSLNVDVEGRDDEFGADTEHYRAAQVRFEGLQFFVIDPPTIDESASRLPTIDTGSGDPPTSPGALPPIREGCSLCWVFVADWNSFIRISARDVILEWDADPPGRPEVRDGQRG
jgi:hypothetical protein